MELYNIVKNIFCYKIHGRRRALCTSERRKLVSRKPRKIIRSLNSYRSRLPSYSRVHLPGSKARKSTHRWARKCEHNRFWYGKEAWYQNGSHKFKCGYTWVYVPWNCKKLILYINRWLVELRHTFIRDVGRSSSLLQ